MVRLSMLVMCLFIALNASILNAAHAAGDKKSGIEKKTLPEKPLKTPSKKTKEEPDDNFKFSIYMTYGEQSSSIQSLTNALFETCSSCPSSHNLGIVGGGIYWIFDSLFLELEGYSIGSGSFNDEEFSTVIGANIGIVNVGWDFSPFSWFRIYPLFGFGLGNAVIEFSNRRKIVNFADYVANPGQNGKLTNTLVIFNMGVGTDFKLEFDEDFGFLFGTRLGYLLTSDSRDWQSGGSGTPILGGPILDMSGPYFKLLFGF